MPGQIPKTRAVLAKKEVAVEMFSAIMMVVFALAFTFFAGLAWNRYQLNTKKPDLGKSVISAFVAAISICLGAYLIYANALGWPADARTMANGVEYKIITGFDQNPYFWVLADGGGKRFIVYSDLPLQYRATRVKREGDKFWFSDFYDPSAL